MEKVTEEFVIAIYDHLEGVHELIIRDTGGLEEVRDKGGLYHSSWKIAEKINNNTGALKVASFIFYELAKKHHFNDGNKRTATESVKIFLSLNDFKLKTPENGLIYISLKIANNEMGFEKLTKWLEDNIESL